MHASDLAQLAALVAHHTPTLIRGTRRLREVSLEQYWVAAKCRLDRWLRGLKTHESQVERTPAHARPDQWRAVRPLLDEILLSEPLTRVWAAFGCAFDHHHGRADVEPIARSVLIGQLEARNRALQLIVFGQGLGAEQAVELNRLRRRVERWTDLMLGYVLLEYPAHDFPFDRSRAVDFADDLRHERRAGTEGTAWELVVSSLQVAFQKENRHPPASADLNQQIASAVIGCFDVDLFDSLGVLKSLWQVRIAQTANDAQGMLNELLSTEPLVSDTTYASNRPLPHRRGRSGRF